MAAMMALDIGLGRMSSHNFGCLPEAPRPPVNSALDKRMLLASTFNSLTTDDSSFPPGPSRMPKVDGEAISAELPTMVPNIPPLHLALFPDPTTVEARRTLLACYWTCSHVSVSLRRPNMLRFTNFMRECLKVLDTSPEALPSDKVLVQWVLLQIVAEEASVTFEFDDPCSDISMEDSRMRLAVRGFARRLEEWKKTAPQSTINSMSLLSSGTPYIDV